MLKLMGKLQFYAQNCCLFKPVMCESNCTKYIWSLYFCRYPAGFVYIFTVFYHLTGQGKDIRLAQYMFAVIYLISLIVIFDIYRRAKKVHILIYMWERSGSVVECLTRDQRAVGSSLTGITALWSLSKTHFS